MKTITRIGITSILIMSSAATFAQAGAPAPSAATTMQKPPLERAEKMMKMKPLIDLNQDGYVGPGERKIFETIAGDKGLQKQFMDKFNIKPEELKAALESGKTVGQFLQEKGIDKADLAAEGQKVLTETMHAKLDEAFKNGKMTKDQKDRIKAEADERLKDMQAKAAEFVKATSTEMKAGGFKEKFKNFFGRFFKRNAEVKTEVKAEVTASSTDVK